MYTDMETKGNDYVKKMLVYRPTNSIGNEMQNQQAADSRQH